ncbi:MAG: tRNA pseudouridine(13) synthase TruD [Anaerolineae bacterium]|jgi:tRNA pseudouridine13 synthase
MAVPYITADLPGIGGQIKVEPGHFVVEEIPLYDPVGEGEHVYVRLTREGWTTRALEKELRALFDLRDVDIGTAGLKDKHARTTQTFSLLLPPQVTPDSVAQRIEEALPVEVEWARRHRNKLRTGHLIGNRFRIVLVTGEPKALSRTDAIVAALQDRGLPNFYGEQRFGADGDNARQGRQALFGRGPRQRWLRRLLLRSYQAALFNAWLTARIERGWFQRLLIGDIAKKTDTGGLFEVEDANVEQPRFDRGEIVFTGPIYGSRMTWASGEPGVLERSILEQEGITERQLGKARLSGTRRRGRLLLPDLIVEPHPAGLLFTFSLPKGAYATTVLREFTKS